MPNLRAALAVSVAIAGAMIAAAPAGADSGPPLARRDIVGGHPAIPGSFGFVADVYIGGQPQCTGTLVAPSWVLTAGHCASVSGAATMGLGGTPATFPPSAYDVKLGTVQTSGADGEDHRVSAVMLDPAFSAATGAANDVALLELATPSMQLPMVIAAAAERTIWQPGTLATIAGFGTTSPNGNAKPATMQVTQVPITTDAYCAAAYPSGAANELSNDGSFDPLTMVCAGYPQGGHDSCEGDSGGPLLAATPAGQLRLVGATSFGNSCAQPGYPGVYARVAQGPVRAWIASVVPGALAPEPSAAPSGSGPRLTKRRRPVISSLRISPSVLFAARRGAVLRPLSGHPPPRRAGGAAITWRDSAVALAAFRIQRLVRGRHRRPRWVLVGSFSHADRRGRDGVRFAGRVLAVSGQRAPGGRAGRQSRSAHTRVLAPGRYRLIVRPVAPLGLPGRSVTVAFTVIRAGRGPASGAMREQGVTVSLSDLGEVTGSTTVG